MNMKVIFCAPELTMTELDKANAFFEECRRILDKYVANRQYVSTSFQMNQLLAEEADKNDILVFFTSEKGEYNESILKLIRKYNDVKSRIWAVAMSDAPACRMPPEPVSEKQSYDVSSRSENRNPLKNNMKAVAQIFARKIIAQTLSPLYQDEVLYFISHRRSDGEHIAAKLADELRLLTRERNVYRDVVQVEVGDDAQKDINKNLELSDVLIFLQTEQAKYSSYIIKELCHALVNDIPILWIQIDNASYTDLKIRPGDAPMLRYSSKEFDCPERLEEIADEIEEKCFQLIMNSSNQVYTYIDYLDNMRDKNKIKLTGVKEATLAYEIEYKEKTRDLYSQGIRRHYIQCFGRNPKEKDIQKFIDRIKEQEAYQKNDNLFLLSNHGNRSRRLSDTKVIEENYDDYIMNLENISGRNDTRRNKRIILSGAFPDCDEIYKNSLIEALSVYSREIIKDGYTLVFGAHPTFQKLIFDIGSLYSSDVRYSIEMHMAKEYINQYNLDELKEKCTLILADGLQEMRENMICKEKSEMLICLGGKIKDNKADQGVDIEVELAKSVGIPVALVGTVGGRSTEWAAEKMEKQDWSDLNPWGKSLNAELFYNVNHKLMVKRLLDKIAE